jgi:threonine dehydrogenase-like Zn-dependent dehydrogenase
MRALVCDREPRLVVDHPEPVRARGEALVQLRVAGICDTDLQLARGYMGFRGVLGHEFVGEVLESDRAEWRGARVVADINAACGTCSACARGDGHHCATRTVLGIVGRDGALAERFTIPERCLVKVPSNVPDERAVFAEPLAAALHAVDDLPRDDGPVVVLGDGKLGQLIARAVLATGRTAVVVGHHEEKLALARRAGAVTLLEANAKDLGGVSAVIEATGSASGIALALALVRPRGTVVLKTTVAGKTEVDLSPVVIHELNIVGSRCGDLSRAVSTLANGDVDPTDLIVARYPLALAADALRRAAQKGALKVLVEFDSPGAPP